jgi:orotidine-5'-phosphate decarboxylase
LLMTELREMLLEKLSNALAAELTELLERIERGEMDPYQATDVLFPLVVERISKAASLTLPARFSDVRWRSETMTDKAPDCENDPRDKIILALDVPTAEQALSIVDELGELISFYKVGLELFMQGGMEDFLRRVGNTKKVFLDLKLPNDIPTTIEKAVASAARSGVKFLTLSNSVTTETIRAAVNGRGASAYPKLLYVSFLSSLDRSDFAWHYGRAESEFEAFLEERTGQALQDGVDGFIVSGDEIGLLRQRYPHALLVSPGIRPSWATADDHKRARTPAEAIRLGSDYLVIGRPVRGADDRRAAAQRVIDEIARA